MERLRFYLSFLYKEPVEGSCSQDTKRARKATFPDINEAVYKWYCLAKQRNIPVSGTLLKPDLSIKIRHSRHQMAG